MFVWPLLTDICGKGSIYSLKSSTRKDGPCTSFPISKITVHEESHTNLHRVSFNKTSHKSSLVITKIININSRVVDTSSGCIVTSGINSYIKKSNKRKLINCTSFSCMAFVTKRYLGLHEDCNFSKLESVAYKFTSVPIILQGKETPYTYWQIHLLIFSTQLILHLPTNL